MRLGNGAEVPRLPGCERWIWDGEFCGRINLRFLEGTEALPAFVSGHIGYAVVPWKRRRGYATEALRLMLPLARAEGLARVEITCDADNEASRRVILANGGVLLGSRLEWAEPPTANWSSGCPRANYPSDYICVKMQRNGCVSFLAEAYSSRP